MVMAVLCIIPKKRKPSQWPSIADKWNEQTTIICKNTDDSHNISKKKKTQKNMYSVYIKSKTAKLNYIIYGCIYKWKTIKNSKEMVVIKVRIVSIFGHERAMVARGKWHALEC